MTNRTMLTALRILRQHSPVRTGNLRYNATNAERITTDTVSVYIDGDIAPYAPYTNETWISPKWNGKKNPNEGWVDRAVEEIVAHLAAELGGEWRKQQ